MVIKSIAASGQIRPLRCLERTAGKAEPTDDPARPYRERIALLEAEKEVLDKQHALELIEAREAGVNEGLAEQAVSNEAALERLEEALAALRVSWTERLSGWDALAAGLAREALNAIFADSESMAETVTLAVRNRLQRLDAASLVRVRVSPGDFPSGADTLVAAGGGIQVSLDPALAKGECIADLSLGHAELSPKLQWARIAELLERAEREGIAA